MGKVRIKQMGIPEIEEAQKEEARKRREAKKAKKLAKKVRAPGLKGGERVVAVGPSPEELEKLVLETKKEKKEAKLPKKRKVLKKRRGRSKKYQEVAKLVEKNRLYPLKEAISLLRKVSFSRFNGTVEAHFNLRQKGFSGEALLPHGTGKKVRVAIANEKLLKNLEKGKIDFDILVSPPQMMPKLARFGRLLGPRGLMPNPKTGTVTDNPEKKAKELLGGKIYFKTERDAPLLHLVFGKMDFKDQQLIENFKALVAAIGPKKIKKCVIKSTMSPGIKVDLAQL